MSCVWGIFPNADRYLCVQQPDLRYFHDRFVGQPMSESWEPPAFEILNKSKKVGDFTGWQIGSLAVLVSSRAQELISSMAGSGVEFLPFATIKGVPLFAMNVLTVLDVVDWERMERDGCDEDGPKVLKSDLKALPVLFKDRQSPRTTFASDALGKLAVEHGLTGLMLVDPRKNISRMIVRGEALNEYPGL